jgi:uncharacterized protein YidB (DUF937 family)
VNLNTADMKDMLSKMGGQRGQAGGMDAIMKLFGASNLQGLMAKLQSKGLGREVKSWVSTGQNQQVTGADIKKAADPSMLRTMANEQGMSPDEMCGHIAQMLPYLIDQATPEGVVPQQGSMGAMKDGAMKDGAMKDGAMKDGAAKGTDAMKKMAKK